MRREVLLALMSEQGVQYDNSFLFFWRSMLLVISSMCMLQTETQTVDSCTSSRTKSAKRTYNTRDSLVVTDPTTSLALTDLSMGERTGSRAFL